MPEKPLTIATYAAGASLAAITLVYVFGPTYLIDNNNESSNSSRKKGVVGLANPANDCFINSVLQALAGLTDLRIYLIRETHRRNIDEPWVYADLVQDPNGKQLAEWKLEGLQKGLVTNGLKDILDALNERPIYKKTISAIGFVRVLETAFRQRISRQQQDAQEFLQVVAERLCDEYHAGRRARLAAKKKGLTATTAARNGSVNGEAVEEDPAGLAIQNESHAENADESASSVPQIQATDASSLMDEEEGFPMEGKYESQIECLTCGFQPTPTESTFCTLTLNVPQVSSTSLNACLDGVFKKEYIDDFKCDKCRLIHAKEILEGDLAKSNSESFKTTTEEALRKLQQAIDTDPEKSPADVVLPDLRYAPKRKIARHTRLTKYPKILAIHLSRSIYDASNMSQKNSAKVSFPEMLPIGGLLSQRKYKLLGTVTHKGSHHSGHYESFRRQNVLIPFSTTNTFAQSDVFSKSGTPSPAQTPQLKALKQAVNGSPLASTPDLLSPGSGTSSSNPSTDSLPHQSAEVSQETNGRPQSASKRSRKSTLKDKDSDSISLRSVAASARSTLSRISKKGDRPDTPTTPNGTPSVPTIAVNPNVTSAPQQLVNGNAGNKAKRKKQSERWWRISDDKIRESKTNDVLGMQREVYLLFYELERVDGEKI